MLQPLEGARDRQDYVLTEVGYIAQLREAVFMEFAGGDRCRGRTIYYKAMSKFVLTNFKRRSYRSVVLENHHSCFGGPPHIKLFIPNLDFQLDY